MDLSIIIVNYNVYEDVKACIESVHQYLKKLDFEIIVVDNNSVDKSIYGINKFYKDVKFIPLSTNFGFGHANNVGMNLARGKNFLLVNPDIIFNDNSIETMYDFLEKNAKAGFVGPVQYKPDVGIEYYYTFFPSIYSRFTQEFRLYQKARLMKKRIFEYLDSNIKTGDPFKVEWIIGSCMMLRSGIFRETGGFDEAFFLYEEETEWQYRMKEKGWLSYMHPGARVLHNNHSSTSKIGKVFIHYQEFRSRIIFDHKRLKGMKYAVRVLLIEAGLGLRVIYFSARYLFSKESRIKLKANFDLLKFNSLSCQKILNSKYDYERKQNLFV
jgi:GT2 family glycosyltransferase